MQARGEVLINVTKLLKNFETNRVLKKNVEDQQALLTSYQDMIEAVAYGYKEHITYESPKYGSLTGTPLELLAQLEVRSPAPEEKSEESNSTPEVSREESSSSTPPVSAVEDSQEEDPSNLEDNNFFWGDFGDDFYKPEEKLPFEDLPVTASRCTVEFLIWASRATYHVKKGNKIDPNLQKSQSTLNTIRDHGYTYRATVPKKSGGDGETHLGSMCLTPRDGQGPIIIAYRGSKTKHDFLTSDPQLVLRGVVSKKLRHEAYKYYLEVRRKNPNKEIILTGHSLGGHFAQYVAARAYHTDRELRDNPKVLARTFNTAPVGTRHSAVFKDYPNLVTKIVNYRLKTDKVSQAPGEYLGLTFTFFSAENFVKSHSLKTLLFRIPGNVLQHRVGTSLELTRYQSALIEWMYGFLNNCHSRGETDDYEILETGLAGAIEYIQDKNYKSASEQLAHSKLRLKSTESTAEQDILLRNMGESGSLENRRAEILRVIYTRCDAKEGMYDEVHIAIALFKYCMLASSMDDVLSIIRDKDHASLMLKYLDDLGKVRSKLGMDKNNLEQAQWVLKELLDCRIQEMHKRKDKFNKGSSAYKTLREMKEAALGKNPDVQLQHLEALKTADGFADLKTLKDELVQVKAGTRFNAKTVKLIEAIITLVEMQETLHVEERSASLFGQALRTDGDGIKSIINQEAKPGEVKPSSLMLKNLHLLTIDKDNLAQSESILEELFNIQCDLLKPKKSSGLQFWTDPNGPQLKLLKKLMGSSKFVDSKTVNGLLTEAEKLTGPASETYNLIKAILILQEKREVVHLFQQMSNPLPAEAEVKAECRSRMIKGLDCLSIDKDNLAQATLILKELLGHHCADLHAKIAAETRKSSKFWSESAMPMLDKLNRELELFNKLKEGNNFVNSDTVSEMLAGAEKLSLEATQLLNAISKLQQVSAPTVSSVAQADSEPFSVMLVLAGDEPEDDPVGSYLQEASVTPAVAPVAKPDPKGYNDFLVPVDGDEEPLVVRFEGP